LTVFTVVARADDINCQKCCFFLENTQTVWQPGCPWTHWGAYSSSPHPLAALRGWDAGRKTRGREGKGEGKGKGREGRKGEGT